MVCTPLMMCMLRSGGTVEKVDFVRQIFEKFFMKFYFIPRVFAKNLTRESRRSNFFSYSCFVENVLI